MLAAAEAKFDRAVAHYEALNKQVIHLSNGDAHVLSVEFDADSGWYDIYARMAKETPPELGVVVGEIAYQLLSALNVAVWELAARQRGRRKVFTRKIARGVEFPMARTPGDFADRPVQNHISRPAWRILAGLQPYNGWYGSTDPHRHPFVTLKDVADSDKHRVVAPVLTLVNVFGIPIGWAPSAQGPIRESFDIEGAKDGAKLTRIRFEVGNDNAQVYVKRQPRAHIFFESDSDAFDMTRVVEWLMATEMSLRALAPLFPRENTRFSGPLPGPD
jgi:hypothetical protein